MELTRGDEIGQLAATITVLEAQRDLLGDGVVEMTVSALQERLESLRAQALPQRKQVTILVADLSGFTAMSETMDPEEVRDTIDRLWQRLDQIIAQWGGHIEQHTGDGVLAYFGVPAARDDDPERAVSAALAMQDEIQAIAGSPEGPVLALRVGVHTGQVLLTPRSSQNKLATLGSTVALANQLEALAPAGEVLVSQDVFRQVERRFLSQPLSSARNSLDEPAYIVRRRARPYGRGGSARAGGVAALMVGRDRELGQLQQWLAASVLGRRGRAVTVTGDAGIGKTRLVQEFTAWLRDENARFPQLNLYELHVELPRQQLPYALLRQLIARCCEIGDGEPVSLARERLVATVRRLLAAQLGEEEATRCAHFLGQLIGLDFEHSPYVQPVLGDARQVRQQATTAALLFFQALSNRAPSLILIEDIHWADEGSLDVLWQLIGESNAGALFLLLSARPTLFERRPEWRDSRATGMDHVLLPLEPLTEQDTMAMVGSLLRRMGEVPADLSATIVEAAGGNPFYVEEIVRVLLEDRIIRQEGDRWRLDSKPGELRIPSTLTGVLQARLDRLAAHERDVLQRAAVVGRVFWDRAIAATAPGGLPSLEETLRQLEEREFIVRQATSSFSGAQEYAFKHALLREVAYESVLVRRQRDFHGAIAAWLNDQCGDRLDENAGLIASHHELAGETATAARWYSRAAEQARARYAPETAIYYYRQALALTAQVAPSPAERVRLYAGLGETLRWQARFDEALEALEAMRAAAEAAGDVKAQIKALEGLFLTHDYQGEHRLALESASTAERLARQAGSPADLAMTLSAKGWSLLFLGEEEQALRLGHEAQAIAREAGAQRELAYSYMLIGGGRRMRGEFERAAAAIKQALELFRERGDRIWEGLMLYHLGQTARLQGAYAKAVRHYSGSLEVARAAGDHYGAMSALSRMGRIARLQGAYRQAERHYTEALALARKSGNVGREAYLNYSLGELKLAQALEKEAGAGAELLAEAEALMRRAVREGLQAEQGVTEAAAHVGLARLHLARGEVDAALPPALTGLDVARLQMALWQGVAAAKVAGTAWWVLGHIAARLGAVRVEGERYDAARCYGESLAIWDKIGSGVAWERARTLRDWSGLLADQGQTARAKAMRREATEIFARLGMVQEIDREL